MRGRQTLPTTKVSVAGGGRVADRGVRRSEGRSSTCATGLPGSRKADKTETRPSVTVEEFNLFCGGLRASTHVL